MFGSTHNFKPIFSSLKIDKSRQRSSISDKRLKECIKVFAVNNLSPNIYKIISKYSMQLKLTLTVKIISY
jgi:hypothetical protein